MREILFRGFNVGKNGKEFIEFNGCKIEGKWAFGSYHTHQIRTPCPIGNDTSEIVGLIIKDGFSDWNLPKPIEGIPVILETVGQYTGLLDKNGKQIFEGDIVECCSWKEFFSRDNEPLKPFQRKFVVAHHNGYMRLREDYDGVIEPNYWDIIFNGDCEVIGTIFDVKESK